MDKTTDKEPARVKNDDKTQQVEDNDIANFFKTRYGKILRRSEVSFAD